MQLPKQIETFLTEIQAFLSHSQIHVNDEVTKSSENNTLASYRSVLGVLEPKDLAQLQKIVAAAQRLSIHLSPVSRGKNIGYGETTPWLAGQFVLNLKNLDAIRSYDASAGEVWVEPGVTQKQLSDFLLTQNSSYWADITGASPESSILGNCLEAGFGYSPLGDHRKNILDMEVLLPDGRLFALGGMPGLGPNLTQLFVQSNFAFVTAIKVPLVPIPEEMQSFILNFASEEDFLTGLTTLKNLRESGVIENLVHTANATRALITCHRFPKNQDPRKTLSESDCLAVLNDNGLLRYGLWTAVGYIHGSKQAVAIKRCQLKKHFSSTATVRFFSTRKIQWLSRLLNLSFIKKNPRFKILRASFESLKAVHGIMRGVPSSVPSEHIFWRTSSEKDLGLIWFSPVVRADRESISRLLGIARDIFAKAHLEMPITLTSINAQCMIAVFSIHFNKSNPDEVNRAHATYKELHVEVRKLGMTTYRLGTMDSGYNLHSPEKALLLQQIKQVLDPHGIVAPGRYGLTAPNVGATKSDSLS